MTKITRNVVQYEIATMRKNYVSMQGDREINNMVEIAVFDEETLAEAYKSAWEAAPPTPADGVVSQTLEIMTSWVEIEPVAENYSLPFNPVYAP